MIDEIKDDIMHILLHIHAYTEKTNTFIKYSKTRYEMAYEIIALNSIAQNIIIRISRLADKRKDVRSIKNALKKFPNHNQTLADNFYQKAIDVMDIRHTQIAHMKSGDLSKYPIEQIPKCVLEATIALVNLIDNVSNSNVNYIYKVGSQELDINLRESVQQGKRIYITKHRS